MRFTMSTIAFLAMFSPQSSIAECTPKEIIALSASGYGKQEIEKLCADKQPAGLQQPGCARDVAIPELPDAVKWQGRLVKSALWHDALGTNYLLISESGSYPVDPGQYPECIEGDACDYAELHGYHFVDDGRSLKRLWEIRDFVNGCSFDITMDYQVGSLEITDLDEDGTSETSFLYRLACRSDVSSATMKLMMHEGKTKYAIRGTTGVPDQPATMTVDPAFDAAPAVFRQRAIERWKLFEDEFADFMHQQ